MKEKTLENMEKELKEINLWELKEPKKLRRLDTIHKLITDLFGMTKINRI